MMSQEFQNHILSTLRGLKTGLVTDTHEATIPIFQDRFHVAALRPISKASLETDSQDVKFITEWRNKHREFFFTWFTATQERTKRWLEAQVIGWDDRALFMVEYEGVAFGHIGVTNFDFDAKSCEVDNVLRGNDSTLPGGMTLALQSLIAWIFDTLGLRFVTLDVFADNVKAISLYGRCGFHTYAKVPLRREDHESGVNWILMEGNDLQAERYALKMYIHRDDC